MAVGDEAHDTIGRRDRRKLETRRRLFDAAATLFAEQGYEATTMQQVADSADVSRATACNYFPHKRDLIWFWLEQRRTDVRAIFEHGEVRAAPTRQRLADALTALAELYESDPDLGRCMVRSWVREGGPFLAGATLSADLFAATLRFGQRRDVRPDIDVQQIGLLLFYSFLGTLFQWAGPDGARVQLAEALLSMLDNVLDPVLIEERGDQR